MPSESDRPIEKQLREQAERRRAAVGKDTFALHPVTRNSLQVEVEREFGKQARSGERRPGWFSWWPRLAFAGGALAVMTLFAVMWSPPGSKSEVGDLALADKSVNAPTPQPAALPTKMSVPEPKVESSGKDGVSVNLQPAPVATIARRQEFLFAARPTQAVAAVAAASKPPEAVTKAAAETRASSADRSRLDAASTASRPSATSAAMPKAQPLQQTFRVSITDEMITIMDADNSVYNGRLKRVGGGTTGASTTARSRTFDETYYKFEQGGLVQRVPVAAQFTLTGTNRTTRQAVQIVGKMVTQTQAAPARASAPRTPGVFLQIQGTATVDGGASFPIDASTQPQ